MHSAAHSFVERLSKQFPPHFSYVHVLEVGSCWINVDVRDLFFACKFSGIDHLQGKNVDRVRWFHEWADVYLRSCRILRTEPEYKTVFSTEALEHDPFAERTVKAMIDVCFPGGLIFLTCAGIGREPHFLETTGHYKNLTLVELQQWFTDKRLVSHIEENQIDHDLYVWAIKE